MTETTRRKHHAAYHYGYQPYCENCEHFDTKAKAIGHTNPCRRVRWEGTKHLEPNADKFGCSDFSPKPKSKPEEQQYG